MKLSIVFYLAWLCLHGQPCAQEPTASVEQQLEDLAAGSEDDVEDDELFLRYESLLRHPLPLNHATKEDFAVFHFLSPLQINYFFQYRSLTGSLVSVYELQAIPGWDVETVRKILPYVVTGNIVPISTELKTRIKEGNHQVVIRYATLLEKTTGILSKKYAGSSAKVFLRYRYQYKNNLVWGITADKDAGEQFFRGAQRLGFDFYSFHFFARDIAGLRAIAIGDFTINMGQGLIQWQSMGFRKGSMVTSVRRQSPVVKPYASAGEHNFNRGVGITLARQKWELSVFGSLRRLSVNREFDDGEMSFTSFLTSGNHRTESEIANRRSMSQLSAGAVLRYLLSNGHIAMNHVYYQHALPMKKQDRPYNLYAPEGKTWHNHSVDFSYTLRNVHVYGEVAMDRRSARAMTAGLLVSMHTNADLAVVYRSIGAAYQAVNPNTFQEASTVSNEHGLYTGVTLRWSSAWKTDMYMDVYSFPWLRYRLDRPGRGHDYLLQITYTPSRGIELYTRWKSERKMGNMETDASPTRVVLPVHKSSLRTHFSIKMSSDITIRHRAELNWYQQEGGARQQGYLWYADIIYKPMMKRWGVAARYQLFESDGYESRLYAYENDVLYGYSIPVFSGAGTRWYLRGELDLGKRYTVWLRIAQTKYGQVETIGTGNDQVKGNRKTDIKLQMRVNI